MQLYSRDRGVSQPIDGHTAAFAKVTLDRHQNITKLFSFVVCTVTGAKVHVSVFSCYTAINQQIVASCRLD